MTTQEVARGFTKSQKGVTVAYAPETQKYGLWVNSELVTVTDDEREIAREFKRKVRGGSVRFENWQY